MDWLRLFALLTAVATVFVTAEGTRKKIRIHIPQKVKHIHHHKKIYITNHPAASQYAPAYVPTADGMSTVALPTVAGLVSLKPMPMYEERRSGQHLLGDSGSGSSLLPMYAERGFYGPINYIDSHNFDLVPPPGPTAASIPTAFEDYSAPAASNPSSKRVKIIKVEPSRKKKIIRKKKPKRIIIHNLKNEDDEHPVSSFHEQFYADVQDAGTIRKIKKPKRVEKIIDGDTEHIHTYSEEHIHKLVFDDQPKLTGLAGIDPSGAGVTALASSNPLLPIKNAQSLLSFEPSLQQSVVTGYGGDGNIYSDLGPAVGSMGTPAQLEYTNYNPREVTHDHVFHDHGELPPYMDISKEYLGHPPKVSYTSNGLKMTGPLGQVRIKTRYPIKKQPPSEFSYYENMFPAPTPSISTPHRRPQRPLYQRPTKYEDESSSNTDISYDDYKPVPQFRPREKTKLKNVGASPYLGNEHKLKRYRPHSNHDIPFSSSSTIVHDAPFKPRHSFPGTKSAATSNLANFKDPFTAFKDVYSSGFPIDAYASSTNSGADGSSWPIKASKGKKKSISTQNISFGGQDHKTTVDHMADSSNVDSVVMDDRGKAVRNLREDDNITPSPEYSITENSPAHEYYTSMALKAFQDGPMSVPESSNTNYQIVEAPAAPPTLTTSTSLPELYYEDRTTTIGTTSKPTYKTHAMNRSKQKRKSHDSINILPKVRNTVKSKSPSAPSGPSEMSSRGVGTTGYEGRESHRENHGFALQGHNTMQHVTSTYERPQQSVVHIDNGRIRPAALEEVPTARGNVKYGDRLQESTGGGGSY